jgi:hypothetical protein
MLLLQKLHLRFVIAISEDTHGGFRSYVRKLKSENLKILAF